MYSADELSSHNGKDGNNAYTAVRGIVIDLDAFMPVHYPKIVPQSALKKYAGVDSSNLFPIQVSAMCQGVNASGIDPAVQLDYQTHNYTGEATVISSSDTNAQYHDFRWATNDTRPAWFMEQMIFLKGNFEKGRIGYSSDYVSTLGSKGNSIAILNGQIFDFTQYVAGGRPPQYPPGQKPAQPPPNSNFMDPDLVELFQQRAGQDVTKYYNALPMDPDLRGRMDICLQNLFYVGDQDTRNSIKCQFSTYFLLAISLMLVSVSYTHLTLPTKRIV